MVGNAGAFPPYPHPFFPTGHSPLDTPLAAANKVTRPVTSMRPERGGVGGWVIMRKTESADTRQEAELAGVYRAREGC